MSNVDRAEIAKFEALAHRWWDRESEFKPLHDINPLRVNWIDERAHLAGKKVLDVGCGGGILSEAMALRGASVTGIDMGEAPLAVARLHQLESGVEVAMKKVVTLFPFGGRAVDVPQPAGKAYSGPPCSRASARIRALPGT